MDEELKYSENGLLNKNIFFDNDIDFYIEDEYNEYRYESIFKELFNCKIENICALGGKNNLKKKYKELKDNSKLEKSFFITDSDFDTILDKEIIKDKHFIYLQKYEIENYIVDKNSVIHVLKKELRCLEKKATKLINYDQWISETYNNLYELFIYYLIVQKNKIKLINTDENANKYFNEDGTVNVKEIKKYRKILENKLKDIGKESKEEVNNTKKIVDDKCKGDLSKLVKGKFIVIGIRIYLDYIIKKETNKRKKINEKNLIDDLFDFFDKKNLSFIKNTVEECLENKK